MKTFFFSTLLSCLIFTVTAQTYRGDNSMNPAGRLNEQYCSGLFKTTDGTILDVQSNPSAVGYLNILDWLNGRVAGLQIYTLRNGTRIPVIRGAQARLFLNEMPIDPAFMNSISPANIAMIKVIKTPFAGSFGNSAAVAVYTIQPEEEAEE